MTKFVPPCEQNQFRTQDQSGQGHLVRNWPELADLETTFPQVNNGSASSELLGTTQFWSRSSQFQTYRSGTAGTPSSFVSSTPPWPT